MPPVVIAAGIAGAATIGGAALASSSQKKAANQAAAAQQQATNQELQLGRENINFQQGIYNQNKATLDPFVQRGDAAGDQINALLGLPSSSSNTAQWDAYLAANPDVGADYNINPTIDHNIFKTPEEWAAYQYQHYGQAAGRQLPSNTGALNNFANSAGMQFQLQQGQKAIQNSAAAHGNLLSGATLKGLQNYGQQTALNNYFMPYLSQLGGQQAVGAQSGAAIAGVGSNFGNTVSSIYGGQQNALQSGADAASNAALLRGQANANLYNGIGSGLGTIASSFAAPGAFGGGAGPIVVHNTNAPFNY